MKHCRRAIAALCSVGVAAAVLPGYPVHAQQLRAIPVTVPGAVYELAGYSVAAPPGTGWFELTRDRNTVVFGKKLASRTHSFIATAISSPMAEKFARPEEFRDFMSRLPTEPEEKRNRLLEHRVELEPGIGPFCVRLYTRAIDRGAINAEGRPLLFETLGVSCLHPVDPALAVNVTFSERGVLADASAELRAEGESFVGSLRFTAPAP